MAGKMHASALPRFTAAILVLSASAASAVDQFSIQLDAGPGLQANPQALASFGRAIAEWEQYLSNPVRVNIYADLTAFLFDPESIADSGAGTTVTSLDYTLVRDAMAARSGRPGNGILNSLPTGAQVGAQVPAGGTFLNATLSVSRANQKALGLIPNALTDTVSDGSIAINNAFSFTYDRSGGVAAGTYDFQTVAAREIGRLLGFVSNTDILDAIPTVPTDATTLDLFRFGKTNAPQNAGEFTSLLRELRPGEAAVLSDLASQWEMSTGRYSGDGNAAGNWKDNALPGGPASAIGIMDPTLPAGAYQSIGGSDLRAMELIGWNTPEPGTGLLIAAAMVMLGRRGRSVVRARV